MRSVRSKWSHGQQWVAARSVNWARRRPFNRTGRWIIDWTRRGKVAGARWRAFDRPWRRVVNRTWGRALHRAGRGTEYWSRRRTVNRSRRWPFHRAGRGTEYWSRRRTINRERQPLSKQRPADSCLRAVPTKQWVRLGGRHTCPSAWPDQLKLADRLDLCEYRWTISSGAFDAPNARLHTTVRRGEQSCRRGNA